MVKDIYVNLAVEDLKRSIEFFSQLGFEFNPQFTDESATCMILSEHIFVMLMVAERFKEFAPKGVCNTQEHNEVLNCIRLEKREDVDLMVEKALKAGGTTYKDAQDHGFMYGHSFIDLDGHVWELLHMPTPPPTPAEA